MMRMRTKNETLPPDFNAGRGVDKEWELRPGGMLVQKRTDGDERRVPPPTIRVRVKYGSIYHELRISSQSTFGELKKMLSGPTGLHHQDQKLFYKDKERNSSAYLDSAGVKDKSKLVLEEDAISKEKRFLEMRKNAKMEKAAKTLSDISLEVDRLAAQASALETVISKGADKITTTYDLVEQMFYLYVRVVKARDLPTNAVTGGCDPYVEVKLGNYKGKTQRFEKKTSPEWNQVFAFSKDKIQSSIVEIFVREKEMVGRDDYLGRVDFDLNEVPTRLPPDSPLAPQWYRLEERRRAPESRLRGEVMLAVWIGSQADEAFPEAWHSDAAAVHGDGVFSVRSKVYVSPKLWYLRVNVIEAQDVEAAEAAPVFVKGQVGNQVCKTKLFPNRTANPVWNEDLLFVIAEPFEEALVLTVESKVGPTRDEVVGRMSIPMHVLERRMDHRPVHSRWFNLDRLGTERKFSTRVHLRACLEGGYHVLDESTLYISDQRPTARQLWKQPIGIVEVGILSANALLPMKARGTTDAYCVAKYGHKWVRTRTIVESFSPTWNEQYTWEVYDPCTLLTLAVFDNCHLSGRDSRIGKVRIRLSTLETDKIYTHSYPLLVLHPSGLKKMGELQLAFRFTCISLTQMIYLYSRPLLPKTHYIQAFTISELDKLRYEAMNIVASRLGRAEPPLRKEVVEYMLDVESHMWSMRRSKANFFRIASFFSGLVGTGRWVWQVCEWKNPITTVLVHVLLCILVCYPELVLPTAFLYMFFMAVWNLRLRDSQPPHVDTKMSWAEGVHPDDLG